MNFNEISKFSGELYGTALETLYKIEILLGYCEYKSEEPLSACMISSILTEIRDKQSQIVNDIDNYTTKVGYELLQ